MNVYIRWDKYASGFRFFVFLSLFFCIIPNLRSETPEEELKRFLSLRDAFLSEYRSQGAKAFKFSVSVSRRRSTNLFFPICWSTSPFYQTGGIHFWDGGDITYYVVNYKTRDRRVAKHAGTKDVFDMPDAFFPMSYMEKNRRGTIYVLLVEKCDMLKLKDFYWANIFPLLDDRISELSKKAETTTQPLPFGLKKTAPVTPAKAESRTPAYRKKVITLPGNVNLEMIKVNAGTFIMGSPLNEEGRGQDEQQHEVTITEDYWIGRYEVTQAQYEAVMKNNPSERAGQYFPVTNVSYNDAVTFCEKLNSQTEGRRLKGYIYALPTEAQWEFAARGGIYSKKHCVYSGSDNIHDVAWFKGNASSVHKVGDKQPNDQGLYDMSGNVWEWVRDMYKPYTADPTVDPDNQDGTLHISRGGGFAWYAAGCRAASRNKDQNMRRDCGFRLALVKKSSVQPNMSLKLDADAEPIFTDSQKSAENETEKGDPDAPASEKTNNDDEKSETQLNQALIYLKRGLKEGGEDDNKKKAVKYARMAAENGLDDAQWLLGWFYLNGTGVEKDPGEAVIWLQKAADQGNAKALKSLAGCYFQGIGVQKDTEKAIRLFRKAADEGNADAQYILGCCYAFGIQVEKDVEKARYWLEKAAENGHKEAREKLLNLPNEKKKDE